MAINVYQVNGDARAVAALMRAGFATVVLHTHRAERFLTCQCAVHEAR